MPNPELRKIRELVALAQAGPAASLPDETHQSCPIPLPVTTSSVGVAFLYSPSRLQRGVGLTLSAPNIRAILDAVSGKSLEVKAVKPSELGVNDEPGKVLGPFGLPEKMTSEQYLVEQGKLYDAYDMLLPSWVAGLNLAEASVSARTAGREFRRLFPRVSEPPLAPYYRAVGRVFWRWLEGAG